MRAAWAGLHFGEEPPVTGRGGSGTIFFSGCTLRCASCQNHQISRGAMGRDISAEDLAEICLGLQAAGAENINVVTGSQFIPGILEGLSLARARGLAIPSLWNSSGYETVESVDLLAKEISVWLPDFKSPSAETARLLYAAPDYPEAARAAILRMAERSTLRLEGGMIRSGVILRHLALPGRFEETRDILTWFAEKLAGRALLSLMTQYTPIRALPGEAGPGRPLDQAEYGRLLELLEDCGLEDGFYQELLPGDDWLPDFGRPNPFSSELARGLWHWKDGFKPFRT